jgi:hypothetical protein
MLELLRRLWEVENLSPHGICLLWRPELIWTHGVAPQAVMNTANDQNIQPNTTSRRRDTK